jgi:hypothetical protein
MLGSSLGPELSGLITAFTAHGFAAAGAATGAAQVYDAVKPCESNANESDDIWLPSVMRRTLIGVDECVIKR